MTVKVSVCNDMEYVASVLRDPEMWERVSEDMQFIEDFVADALDEKWICLELKTMDGSIGVWILHPVNQTTWKIHAHVLSQHREKYAKEAGRAVLTWMDKKLPDTVMKIVADIPVTRQDVYHYAKNHGFKDEGINRASIQTGGELVDQYYLGITREELSEWVEGAEG